MGAKLFEAGCLLLSLLCLTCSAKGIQWYWHGDYETPQGRALDLNDFEAGTTSPWNDESAADARWVIETFDSPLNPNVPAPQPSSGSKYLRVNRPAGTSGQAILHSAPFTVSPGDTFSLNFWIRSEIMLVSPFLQHTLINLSDIKVYRSYP